MLKKISISLFTITMCFQYAFGASDTWLSTGAGNWNTAGNWVSSGIPNGSTQTATFDSAITAASTVTLDINTTLGGITFNNANSYTITPAATQTITMDNGGGTATITNTTGSHTIGANTILTSDTTVTTTAGTLTMSGIISSTGTLTKNGSGNLILSGANTNTGLTTVSAGKLTTSAIAGSLTVGTGAVIDPGNALNTTGTLTVAGNAGSLANGTFLVEIGDADAASDGINAGTDYDYINFSTTYNLAALSGNPLTIKIRNKTAGFYTSLEGLGSFTNSTYYGNAGLGDIKIMNNVSGYSASYFTIDSDILNINWELKNVGSALWLSYAAVPEPSTYIMCGGLLFTILIGLRKRIKIRMKTSSNSDE
jgi:autotransporter-associated beta strand protein